MHCRPKGLDCGTHCVTCDMAMALEVHRTNRVVISILYQLIISKDINTKFFKHTQNLDLRLDP